MLKHGLLHAKTLLENGWRAQWWHHSCTAAWAKLRSVKWSTLSLHHWNRIWAYLVNSHGWSPWDRLTFRVNDVMLRFLCLRRLLIHFKNVLLIQTFTRFIYIKFIHLPEYRSYDDDVLNF